MSCEESKRAPEDGGVPREESKRAPADGGVPREESKRAPEDGGVPREESKRAPEDGGVPREERKRAPEDGGVPREERKRSGKKTKGNAPKTDAAAEAPPVWLVFVEEETGPEGYPGGWNYESGSHSANLVGVYTSKEEADMHAESLREDDSDDEDNDDDDDHVDIRVVKAPVKKKYNGKQKSIWRFDADTEMAVH